MTACGTSPPATTASTPDAAGLVLVIDRYDLFAAHHLRPATILLDIFAREARSAALYGHRMLCLVRTDLPESQSWGVVGRFCDLGGCAAVGSG